MHPMQIASLILGIISIILGIPVAVITTRSILEERHFWKSSHEKNQGRSDTGNEDKYKNMDLDTGLAEVGLRRLTEEEREQLLAGKCLSEMNQQK